MNILIIAGIFIALTGFILIVLCVLKFFKRKLFSAFNYGLIGLLSLSCGAAILLLVSGLYTYQRLTYEKVITTVEFSKISKQQYKVSLQDLDTGKIKKFVLYGDEWQLDAQILKWSGLANLIGLNAEFRLQRLSGRYTDIKQEKNKKRTVYSLQEKEYFDLWRVVQKYNDKISLVDAIYGNAVYLPMKDKARFNVSMTQSGLVARPDNKEAFESFMHWIDE